MPKDNDANWGKFAFYGVEIAVGTGLGWFVGQWLDKKFGWDPWGVLIGTMLGVSAGMYLLIKDAIRINRD